MPTVQGLKAFRIDSKGKVRFLFHAFQGTSIVPMDRWIETKRPWGSEDQRAKKYRLAFHFLREPERVEKFQKMTKNKYIIVPILAQGVEPKPQTSVGSWLAKRIFVSSILVQQALDAHSK
jgi:hypothetical protein